jgi:hypothetical protein
MKYGGTVTIVDDEGTILHERELDADEMIEELLNTERVFESEEPEDEPEPAPPPVVPVTRKPYTFKKHVMGCDECGSKGRRHKKGCKFEGGKSTVDVAPKTKAIAGLDADARLRVKRMVDGGIDSEEIKKALKRADFDYEDREVEEMIAWAQHA